MNEFEAARQSLQELKALVSQHFRASAPAAPSKPAPKPEQVEKDKHAKQIVKKVAGIIHPKPEQDYNDIRAYMKRKLGV